jgi:alcohol dehydrogenase
VYDAFGVPPDVRTVPDPTPSAAGAVLRVRATGVCRSDWHGWLGHDPDIVPPHVPGHELSGEVVAVGAQVHGWRGGERVTVPFVCGCGRCAECVSGHPQVCERQFQPGFTGPGSFADYVAIEAADHNLVALPDETDHAAAAALGCRFATAYRAVLAQGRVRPGQWVAIYGCGGVGLSAVMIAAAAGARVVGVDVSPAALALARDLGAEATVDARAADDVVTAVRDLTGGGAHVGLDALGDPRTCVQSVRSLRRRGRHVQVGLLPGAAGVPQLPMEVVIAHELEVVGSHGMAAHAYPEMLALVVSGRLRPQRLVTRRIGLDALPAALVSMGAGAPAGVTVAELGAD